MHSLLWVFWLCPGSSAVRQAAVGEQEDSAPLQLAWGDLALGSAVILLLALALGVRRLSKEHILRDAEEMKGKVPANPEELESRLVDAFSQMEQELVKLVTLVHKRKAGLTVRHRRCKAVECQQTKGSSGTFNLAIYDIVED